MVYTFIIFSLFFTASQVTCSLLEDSTELEPCSLLFNPESIEAGCCENVILDAASDECKSSNDSSEWTCEDFKCILEVYGFMDGDVISEQAVKDFYDDYDKENPDDKAMTKRMRDYCLDGKYFKYQPEDEDCPAAGFELCVEMNIVVECPKWKNSKECKDMPELAKKCKLALDNIDKQS